IDSFPRRARGGFVWWRPRRRDWLQRGLVQSALSEERRPVNRGCACSRAPRRRYSVEGSQTSQRVERERDHAGKLGGGFVFGDVAGIRHIKRPGTLPVPEIDRGRLAVSDSLPA